MLERFWGVTLGTLRPKLVIVSTPNAEFNVCFAQLKYGTPEAIFRNDDHRFEWTRAEFEAWSTGIAARFGYAVRFDGVGLADAALGAPSQMATFAIR